MLNSWTFYFVCFPERNRWLQPFNKRLVRVIMEGGRGLEIKFINFCVCSAFEWCLQWFCGTFDVVVCDISSGVVQLGQYFIPSLGEVNRYFRGWARGSVNQVTNQSVKEVWSLLPFLLQRKDKKGSSVTLYPIRNLSNLCELVLTKVPSSAYLKDLFIISFQN